jgi:hypothetical protein
MNPVRLFVKTFAVVCLSLCMVGAHAASPVAGYVTKVRGEVVAASESGRQTLALGHALHQGYRLLTGADARLEARMKDGTVLTLGERTEFVIEQVTGAAVNSKSTRFELLKGAFRAVTAAPETTAKLDWQVRTPVAIIGVRGTEVWGGFNLLGAGDSTLDVVMFEGKGVFVETASGMTDLVKAGDGTTVAGADARPAPLKPWGEKKLQAAIQSVSW